MRSMNMKMKNTLSAIVVAMAAFAAPFSAKASTKPRAISSSCVW